MAEPVPLIDLGDEVAVILPDALLAKMGVGIGDDIWLVEKDGALELRITSPEEDRSAE